jgi:phosphoglycerate kinase
MASLDDILRLDELRLEGQRVLIRADLDVPLDDSGEQVLDDRLLRSVLPSIEFAREAGARVIVAGHRGRPQGKRKDALSLEPVAAHLAGLAQCDVLLPDDCIGEAAKKVVGDLRTGQICVLENLRFHAGEDSNQDSFAARLAELCDVYVNDAPGLAHCRNASLHALPQSVRNRGCGRFLEAEISGAERLGRAAVRPYVVVLGGNRIASRLEDLELLAHRADTICIGGAFGNTLLAAQGVELDSSDVERSHLAECRSLLDRLRTQGIRLVLPVDAAVAEQEDAETTVARRLDAISVGERVWDIGPETAQAFSAAVSQAKTALVMGPLGRCEDAPFTVGTRAVAHALTECGGFTAVVGSTTSEAVRGFGPEVSERIDFVSAVPSLVALMLRSSKLPALDALRTPGQ